MRTFFRSQAAILVCLAGAVLTTPSRACAQESDAESPAHNVPIVVEMFLSQACKSCPPAAELLGELRNRPDLIVLSWHIDYWNLLSNRKYGRWMDPYSKAEFSERQRLYNRVIRRRSSVFTPQAIIAGAASVIGSKREAVETQIDRARETAAPMNIEFAVNGESLSITLDTESNVEADVYLIRFHDWRVTEIDAGDNAGIVFREPNIVVNVTRLGGLRRTADTFTTQMPETGMGCAVIVQETGPGPILGARYCP